MSKATVVSSSVGGLTALSDADQSVAQMDLGPGSYVVMVKLNVVGSDVQARLTVTNYEIIDTPGGTPLTQEIPVGPTAVVDEAQLFSVPQGRPQGIAVTLSAMGGVKVHPRGRAECICRGPGSVEKIVLVAIEVDELTVITQ
jgi:hypothetical protein